MRMVTSRQMRMPHLCDTAHGRIKGGKTVSHGSNEVFGMNLAISDIARILGEVLCRYDVAAAFVFGSFARGDFTDSSDVDIRLECGPAMRYATLLNIQRELEAAFGKSVDIVTCRPEHLRPRFRERMENDEVKLYEAA